MILCVNFGSLIIFGIVVVYVFVVDFDKFGKLYFDDLFVFIFL